jgi:hypothetical protein
MFDVIHPKYHSSSSSVLIMLGFGIGALAPYLMSKLDNLSMGITMLGIIWIFAGVVMLVGSKLFYRKDFEKLQKNE